MKATQQLEIRQHNAITSARYDYSAVQLDILFYLLAKLNKDDAANKAYQIQLKEIEAITGRSWNYQQLKDATADMGSRMFEVNTTGSYKQIWIFQEVTYEDGKGYFTIKLSEAIRPYLFELKSNFTSYQLHSALKLTSKFAKRIYQLASQWKDVGESKPYSIDEFKVMLNLKDPEGKEPEQFERVNDLKRKVLDIAVQQINKHTDLKIDYKLIKDGRSFSAIRFYINRQSVKQLPIPFEQTQADGRLDTVRRILEDLGIKDEKLVHQILTNEAHLTETLKFNWKLKTDKIKADKNPGGLLLTVLGLR